MAAERYVWTWGTKVAVATNCTGRVVGVRISDEGTRAEYKVEWEARWKTMSPSYGTDWFPEYTLKWLAPPLPSLDPRGRKRFPRWNGTKKSP